MRPLYHSKADRLLAKADTLESEGLAKLEAFKNSDEEAYQRYRRAVAHIIMGLGGETDEDTTHRLEVHGPIDDEEIVKALVSVMRQDAFNHKELQALDGRDAGAISDVHGRQHRV